MRGINLFAAGALMALALAGNTGHAANVYVSKKTPVTQQAMPQQQAQQVPAQPSPNVCPFVKAAQINVVPQSKPLKYDTAKTLAELQATESDTINPYGFRGVSVVQGFTEGKISIGYQAQLGSATYPQTGMTCLWYDTINVPITVENTVIIAREVYNDACLRDVVVGHELKHVNMNYKMANDYSKIIGQKIYKALEDRGFRSEPVPAAQAKSMGDRMLKLIAQIVETEQQRMELDRMDKQRGIDSLDEYERLSKMCPESQAKMPQWATQVQQPKGGVQSYGAQSPHVYRPVNR